MNNFNPLDIHLNVAVQVACARLFNRWDNFDLTDNDNEVNTLEKATAYFNETGRIKVWSGASDKTIFDCAGINHAFRAWHDFHHITKQLPFTPEGEMKVVQCQMQDLIKIYGDNEDTQRMNAILWAEVVGQGQYEELHGAFPDNQKGFIKAYLVDAQEAIAKPIFHTPRRKTRG